MLARRCRQKKTGHCTRSKARTSCCAGPDLPRSFLDYLMGASSSCTGATPSCTTSTSCCCSGSGTEAGSGTEVGSGRERGRRPAERGEQQLESLEREVTQFGQLRQSPVGLPATFGELPRRTGITFAAVAPTADCSGFHLKVLLLTFLTRWTNDIGKRAGLLCPISHCVSVGAIARRRQPRQKLLACRSTCRTTLARILRPGHRPDMTGK